MNKIFLLLFLLPIVFFTSCKEETPGKYEMTDGLPAIYYVRYQDKDLAEQLLDGAYMNENIVIIGENLTSVQEVWFNNVKALLNINLITKNTLFVTVPKDLPSVRTDKIYFVNEHKDTLAYDFQVKIPAPILARIKCEQVPEGREAVLIGDYFLATEASLIKILIGDYEVPTSDIISYEKNKIVFKSPAMDVRGPVEVKTLYGSSGRTKAVFHDNRGWITGFEDSENGGTGFVPGWGRPTHIEDDPNLSLTGKYVKFSGDLGNGSWASGGNDFTINIWSSANGDNPNSGIPNPMFASDPATSTLKFEINVLQGWKGLPMIFAFKAAGDNESYLWNDGTSSGGGAPRAFWMPWLGSGSYVTDGWETISIPLSEMIYNGSYVNVGMPKAFAELGISIHNRGYEIEKGKATCGEPSSPVILIDNIRVVP